MGMYLAPMSLLAAPASAASLGTAVAKTHPTSVQAVGELTVYNPNGSGPNCNGYRTPGMGGHLVVTDGAKGGTIYTSAFK